MSSPKSKLMELPREVLTEIVCRLPVSTVYNIFKAKSFLCNKELYDIISDPNFPMLFQTYSNVRPCSFLAYDHYKTFLAEYDPNTNTVNATRLSMSFLKEIKGSIKSSFSVLDSCNGWLLTRLLHINPNNNNMCDMSLHLVNPITRRYVTIKPASPLGFESTSYAFGYIQNTGTYKVIKFWNNKMEITEIGSNAGSGSPHWRSVSFDSTLYGSSFSYLNVTLNGVCYWLFERAPNRLILKFDMEKEEFAFISTPEQVRGVQYCKASLGVLNGKSLYIGILHYDQRVQIWAMNVVKQSWTVLMTTAECKLKYKYFCSPKVLGIFDNGNMLILTFMDKLVLYDRKQNKIERNLRTHGMSPWMRKYKKVVKFEPTLLSLKDPVGC